MSDYPSNVEVRRWAQSQSWGHKVSERGQFPKSLIAAWNRAHPDRPYKATEAYHGTTSGYFKRDCRCERCSAAMSAYMHDKYAAAADSP